MKGMPTVRNYMSTGPHTIGVDQPLTQAHAIMSKNKIRHLPVLEAGKLLGVVTDRDLHLVESLRDVVPEEVKIEEAMTPMPYTVWPDTPMDEVVEQMAEHKYGCAVVIEGRHVVGVLTTVDVCRALADQLRRDYRSG